MPSSPGSAARAGSATPRSTRCSARSASPCWRPTSISSSSAAWSTASGRRASGLISPRASRPPSRSSRSSNQQMVETLGGETLRITYASKPPTVVLLAGLQGSGKTTAAAKLGRWFKQQGRSPLLVGADLQRPAAVEQLRVLGQQAGRGRVQRAVRSGRRGPGRRRRSDPGRPRRGHHRHRRPPHHRRRADGGGAPTSPAAVSPHYTFLVIDAMIGQDAVTTAEAFHQRLALDGVIISKLDGDARGGAALSVKEVVGRPIVFASTGEKLADFEPFHPDRMASRILGMGDVLSLIERAEQEYDSDVAARAAERLQEGAVHPRGLPRADAADQEDGSALGSDEDDARPAQGAARTRRSTSGSCPGSRGSSIP